MASTQNYYNATSLPIDMSSKSRHAPAPAGYRQASLSPPEVAESVTTSGVSSTGPSFSNLATSSNASSASGEYDSARGASSIDLMDLLNDRLTGAFDPLPLDRSLATQTQT